MQKQPLLILCVCFILGIFTQDFLLWKLTTIYILLIVSFLSLFIFLLKNYYFRRIRYFSLFLLFFSLGIFAHFIHSKEPNLPELGKKEIIDFKLEKKLNSNEKNKRYEILGWKGNESFNCVLSVPKSENDLDFTHYYKAELYLQKIENPYQDFQFNYAKYLSRKGIYFQAYLPNSMQAGKRNDLSFTEEIKQKRIEVLQKIDRSVLSKEAKDIMKGIILADRTEMEKSTVQDFTRSGLVHILAISGSHMAVIFWLILIILKPVFPPKFRQYKIVISLILIWTFAIFINYGNSVVRSCVMISAYYIFILLQRKPDLLHAMAIAAFSILIVNTNQLFEVGFQLSFLAVLGIFWLNQPILKYLPNPKNRFQNMLLNIVSVSLSAQIATLPLVIYYFHQYSFISIVANFVIIPFVEILIIFSLLITVLINFSLQFKIVNFIYDHFVSLILKAIHFFAEVDFVFFKNIPITLMEVAACFMIIYYLRFLIVKPTLKNGLRVFYFVAFFGVLRLSLNYKADEMQEILVHQYYDQPIISIKDKKQIIFVIKEGLPLEKIENYIINPYLTSRRQEAFVFKKVPKTIDSVKIGDSYFNLR